MVVAIDPDHIGQLHVADKTYGRTVAGVMSGAGDIKLGLILHQEGKVADGDYPVSLTGGRAFWPKRHTVPSSRAVSRRQLTDEVWGEGWVGYGRTLNVHVYRLRQKLEDEPAAPRYIETVRRYGYRFVAGALQRIGNGTD